MTVMMFFCWCNLSFFWKVRCNLLVLQITTGTTTRSLGSQSSFVPPSTAPKLVVTPSVFRSHITIEKRLASRSGRKRIFRYEFLLIFISASQREAFPCTMDTFDAEPRILVSKKPCSSNFVRMVLIGSFIWSLPCRWCQL